MQTSFRSGILRHQTDRNSNPIFLRKSGSNVTIVVSPDPTIITFIDGTTDYIYSESVTVDNAWNTAMDGAYLYWELNRVTGVISYGSTMLNPASQSTAPASPVSGQLWFDTINKYWFRWNGYWVRSLIVFSAKVVGTLLISMSDNSNQNDFRGTQVGINTTQGAGSLVYDLAGVAIQNSLGQFFTTEDDFVAGVPFGSSMRIEALATYATANMSFSAYTVVRFNDFNQIVQADNGSQLINTIGIVEEDADVGDRIRVVYAGPITNEFWDWSSYEIDTPIYVSAVGVLSTSPVGAQLPIARVIGKKTILFEPWLGSQAAAGGGGGVTAHSELSGLQAGNDHPQYVLANDAVALLNDLTDVDVVGSPAVADGMVLTYNGVRWEHRVSGSGVTDHTLLTNIGSNTHTTIDAFIASGPYEPAFTKNTAFNLNLGGSAGQVSEGNHAHTGVYEPVFAKNTGFNLVLGTGTGQVSEGDHTHTGVYEPANANIQNHIADSTIHFTKESIIIGDLGDVTVGGSPAIDNFVLTYNDTSGQWGAEAAQAGASALNDLTDVNVTNGAPIDNYVLTYDHGTSRWVAEASAGGGGGATPYDIIAQSIGVPTDGDVLTRMVFSRAVTIGNGSPIAHQGYAAIPPSGGAGTISVYKASPPFGGSPSGSLIGTLVFNDGSTSLDSETVEATSFAVGDLVWFEMTSGNSMGDLTVTLDATAD